MGMMLGRYIDQTLQGLFVRVILSGAGEGVLSGREGEDDLSTFIEFLKVKEHFIWSFVG
jgi:hypothetical protein